MSSNLTVYLTGYDRASRPIMAVAGQVGAFGRQIETMGCKVEDADKRFIDFNRVLETATGMILRDVINSITQATVEAVNLGAQIDTLRASFTRLTTAAGSTRLNLERLRAATQGTVSDIDLLTQANRALSMELPVDSLNEFYHAAMLVGHAMGITTAQAADRLTIALGRQSKLVLDDLGIVLDTDRAFNDFARTLGVTASQLTEAQRKMAWQNAAIAALMDRASILEGTISEGQLAQERWNASIANAKTEIGGFLGPLGQIAPLLQGAMPLIGALSATLLPSLITQVGGATAVVHGLNVAVKALLGPIGLAIAAISLFGAALATDFMGIRTALTDLTKDEETRFREQTDAIKAAAAQQRSAIDQLVADVEVKYAGLTAALKANYEEQLEAAHQHAQEIQKARDKDLDALELQYLKEKQAIEESEQPYANKQYYLDRLEKKYGRDREQMLEDYRRKELEATTSLQEEERRLAEQHNEDLLALEREAADAIAAAWRRAEADRLAVEVETDAQIWAARDKLNRELAARAAIEFGQEQLKNPFEDYTPPVIPFVGGAKGFLGTVDRPTLFLAGERGRERVSITPERGAGEYALQTPTQTQLIINGPLLYVEGSADAGVAEQIYTVVPQILQNITIEATSPSAPASQRRIRLGTTLTTPSTVKPSSTLTGGTLGGGLGRRLFQI